MMTKLIGRSLFLGKFFVKDYALLEQERFGSLVTGIVLAENEFMGSDIPKIPDFIILMDPGLEIKLPKDLDKNTVIIAPAGAHAEHRRKPISLVRERRQS